MCPKLQGTKGLPIEQPQFELVITETAGNRMTCLVLQQRPTGCDIGAGISRLCNRVELT